MVSGGCTQTVRGLYYPVTPSYSSISVFNRKINTRRKEVERRCVGSNLEEASCVPFISEYSDCTEANQCSGCTKCSCSKDSKWICKQVTECDSQAQGLDDLSLDNALDALSHELKNPKKVNYAKPRAPKSEDLLLVEDEDIERKIINLMIQNSGNRMKRSLKKDSLINNNRNVSEFNNKNVDFFHTTDEINEDTLKNSNASGTIQANKVHAAAMNQISRRNGVYSNVSSNSSFKIDYKPQIYDHHIADNKIDTTSHYEDKFNLIHGEKLGIFTNDTQREKNKDISKIIVNELKSGIEIIGDKDAPIMSNITFTPQNDTLTAMAFIAGNLLNKLWSMEKASSDESGETEALKHEKIADLLDLFKEPLSMRQEAFLKSALEKLSEALDKNKDVSNISLCENIKKAKQILKNVDKNSSWEKNKVTSPKSDRENRKNGNKLDEAMEKRKNITAQAITKINTVLSLIKKFEDVNKNLIDLKRVPANYLAQKHEKTALIISKPSETDTLSESETNSINLFGNVLEKITKLLLPNKLSKKIGNKIRGHSIFGTTNDVKQKLKETYNVELDDDTTLTAKDKLVLDYLAQIKNNLNCILNKNDQHTKIKSEPNIDGDILHNLSEFYKIKSFVDLIKLLEADKQNDEKFLRTPTTSTIVDVTENPNIKLTSVKDTNLASTKEKLKAHLKTILDDLIELQKEKGISTKEGEIKIADALPCIYNIMNADEKVQRNLLKDRSQQIRTKPIKLSLTPLEKITTFFDEVKKDFKTTPQTRRSNKDAEVLRKSAVVWERVVKNLDGKQKQTSRRKFTEDSTNAFENIKKMIQLIDTHRSNTYKNFAIYVGVPPTERLMLLKTLQLDVKQYVEVLKNIKRYLTLLPKLPSEERIDVQDFVENAAMNINLDEKVIKTVINPIVTKNKFIKKLEDKQFNYKSKEEMRLPEITPPSPVYNKDKLSKDQILNQLIKNRIKLYLRIKENKEANPSIDMNYNIAKTILFNLERGNFALAREMYKVFVVNKYKASGSNDNYDYRTADNSSPKLINPRRQTILKKEPLIQFEDQKSVHNQMTLDQMLQQFLRMQNTRI